MTEIATTYGQALYDLASAEGLSQEILQQFPDMTVDAGATVTRGDMAKLLNKTMQVIGK